MVLNHNFLRFLDKILLIYIIILYNIILYLLRGYYFPRKLFMVDNFLSLNQLIPLFYIFYLSLSLGLRVCLPLHIISERKKISKIDTS